MRAKGSDEHRKGGRQSEQSTCQLRPPRCAPMPLPPPPPPRHLNRCLSCCRLLACNRMSPRRSKAALGAGACSRRTRRGTEVASAKVTRSVTSDLRRGGEAGGEADGAGRVGQGRWGRQAGGQQSRGHQASRQGITMYSFGKAATQALRLTSGGPTGTGCRKTRAAALGGREWSSRRRRHRCCPHPASPRRRHEAQPRRGSRCRWRQSRCARWTDRRRGWQLLPPLPTTAVPTAHPAAQRAAVAPERAAASPPLGCALRRPWLQPPGCPRCYRGQRCGPAAARTAAAGPPGACRTPPAPTVAPALRCPARGRPRSWCSWCG